MISIKKPAYTIGEVAKRWNTDEQTVLSLCESGQLGVYFNWINLEASYMTRLTMNLYKKNSPSESFSHDPNNYLTMLAKLPIGLTSNIKSIGRAVYSCHGPKDTEFEIGSEYKLRIIPRTFGDDEQVIGDIEIRLDDLVVKESDLIEYEGENGDVRDSDDLGTKAQLRLIAALTETILASKKNMTQANLIDYLFANYGEEYNGFSVSSIQKLLPAANKALAESKKR